VVTRALVTGANGFIGSHLVRRLLAEGVEVHALTHRSADNLSGLACRVFRGDVNQPQSLPAAFAGVDLVFHLAARATDWGPRREFFRVNVEGTRAALVAAREAGCRRFVLLSSLAVHRFTGHLDADEDTPADQARYAYGASKAAAEELVRAAQREGRLETTILRPGVVVHGPGDTTAFVHMAPVLMRGRWPHVGRGRFVFCYSYVENLVDGVALAGLRPEGAGRTLNITDDIRPTWAEYIEALQRLLGNRRGSISFPVPVARAAGWSAEMLFRLLRTKNPPPITDYRTALVSRDFHFSCARAKEILGYRPRVPFEEGLRRMVEWYRSRG
jgi:nucleoside-diphosphate-sugar epimerase